MGKGKNARKRHHNIINLSLPPHRDDWTEPGGSTGFYLRDPFIRPAATVEIFARVNPNGLRENYTLRRAIERTEAIDRCIVLVGVGGVETLPLRTASDLADRPPLHRLGRRLCGSVNSVCATHNQTATAFPARCSRRHNRGLSPVKKLYRVIILYY